MMPDYFFQYVVNKPNSIQFLEHITFNTLFCLEGMAIFNMPLTADLITCVDDKSGITYVTHMKIFPFDDNLK